MATVDLRFSALPSHVRTARLVATAVARRSGVDEAVLDEVRLAVGEACSRAVELHRRHCPDEQVQVTLSDDTGSFRVQVRDQAPAPGADESDALEALADSAQPDDADTELLPSGVGIAVISGLVDDVRIDPGPHGTSVEMTWPSGPVAGL